MMWTAFVFFFLAGAAALAIDASDAFGAARTDQNTADLACLAGVRELPNQTGAINTAVAYLDANWPAIQGSTLTITLPTATYDAGNGNMAFLDTSYGATSDGMLIRITEVSDTSFGALVGQDSITVVQEAACSGQSVRTGIGMLPIGALTGQWNGDLFDCAAKVTGNCGALSPHRPGGNAYRDAVAEGIDGDFAEHWGHHIDFYPDPSGWIAQDCLDTPCSVTETEPGNMSGPFRQGVTNRLTDTTGVCTEASWFNCDSITDVFATGDGAGLEALASKSIGDVPSWQTSIHGDFVTAQNSVLPKHWYYNDDNLNCDSVRLATIPAVNEDIDWDLLDAAGTWPNGRKDMKMVGFYTVFIRMPAIISDIGGPMEADVIWFGLDAACSTGEAFQPFGAAVAVDTGVKLVAP